MNAKVENKEFGFGLLKWIISLALVIGAIVGNSVFADVPTLYRVLAIVAAVVVAALIAVTTTQGNAFWELLKASQVELRKVVWPSTQEVNQTSMLVVAVVIVTALILWGLDALIGFGAGQVIG